MNDLIRGMIIGFCAGIVIAGLAASLFVRRNIEREKRKYAETQIEIQTELQSLREDYFNRTADEFLDDPAIRGAVDGAAGEFERRRDELLQRFRRGITD